MGDKIDNSALKAIAKWRNHPSILAMASEYTNRETFSSNFVSKEDVLTEKKYWMSQRPFRRVTFRLKLLIFFK